MFDFLSRKFSDLVGKLTLGGKLTEANISESLEQVKEALLEADVPLELVLDFVDSVKKEALGKKILASTRPGDQFVKIVYDKLVEFMGGKHIVPFSFQIPAIVMVMGLQGSGKTTSIAKMVRFVQKQAEKKGKKRYVLVASVDYYRPAALEQLQLLAGSINTDYYKAVSQDPVTSAREIVDRYKNGGYELLFLDTAGRLHIDMQMLQELKEITKVVNPRYKILVLDSMTGQESLHVAKEFDQKVGIDGALLTKLDSDTRGGAAFAFRYSIKKPLWFVGSGEKADDLDLFRPDRAAGRILGMGDVLSLVEKAEEQVKEADKLSLEKSFKKGSLTLEDFASQMNMVKNMGSLNNIMKYIPGAGSIQITAEMMEKAEKEMKQFRAALSSMTPCERLNPQ